MAQTLLLIDGNSILNRAYFALPALNDSEGRNVNAVYGFTNILIKVVDDYKPDKLVVAFDKHGHNFRKDIFADYKANRHGMPDDLAEQMPILHDLLATMNVTVVEKAGVEADDIIGTLSKRFDGNSYIVSGDRDMFQLVDDNVTVLFTKKGVTDLENVTPELLQASYCLTPNQVIEYKSLRGDTSDNIPGVYGIGEKTAMTLLAKYNDIDNLYEHVDEEKGALHDKLVNGKEMAFISRKLATIVRDADVECNFDECFLPSMNDNVKAVFEKLQFRSLISRMVSNTESSVQEQEVNVVEVTDEKTLASVISKMLDSNYFAVEVSNGITLSCDEHEEYKIVISDNFLDGMTEDVVWNNVKALFESNVEKAVYDGKALRHVLCNYGIELNNVKYDVCLMQYLVEYRAYKDLPSLAVAYGYKNTCSAIFALAKILDKELKKDGTEMLYYDVELPLSALLYSMEQEGVKVDVNLLDSMSEDLHLRLDALTEEICNLCGEKFNVASPKQLSTVLFEHMGLEHGKKTKTGYSTNNEVLEYLIDDHPVIAKILEYRRVSKLLGTYLDGLKPLLRHNLIHTTYNQALTSTGRLSSSDPNLQNIPVRSEEGREIRKLFLPKNGIFVGADYSQIELRLLAAFSHDENLIEAFKNGVDIHAKVASELVGIPVELVNKDMRRMAKAVNFGIIYGISDYGLSQNAHISINKAHEYIELYFKRFPKIKDYLSGSVENAKRDGFVTTLSGRRRQIPEIKSSNYNLRAFGERAAMNMPLQGSAADIMKIAMLRVDKALKDEGLKSKLVLQIHDEIIVDCFKEEAEQVKAIVKREMENAVTLDCPLTVETEEGETLYEA